MTLIYIQVALHITVDHPSKHLLISLYYVLTNGLRLLIQATIDGIYWSADARLPARSSPQPRRESQRVSWSNWWHFWIRPRDPRPFFQHAHFDYNNAVLERCRSYRFTAELVRLQLYIWPTSSEIHAEDNIIQFNAISGYHQWVRGVAASRDSRLKRSGVKNVKFST